MSYAIETNGLTKEFIVYRKTTVAINDVNLLIKEGELFGIIGANGAGKTTLIKILCCLILPTKGTACVHGYDILQNEEQVKSCIGLVSGEERSFYWRLTGRQNLQFFASLYNISASKAKERIKYLLDLLEIREPDRRYQEYSTGIKQRLAIAKSLLNDPKVLFIDEPTKSLDPETAQRVRAFIKNKIARQQNITVFFATHNLEEAEYLADHLALIDKGEIKVFGTMEEVGKNILTCFSAS